MRLLNTISCKNCAFLNPIAEDPAKSNSGYGLTILLMKKCAGWMLSITGTQT